MVEASSGSTAVSEAYFAKMIGVPFVAVMPKSTAQSKIALIERYGGQCHFVDCPTQMHSEATKVAHELNGILWISSFSQSALQTGVAITILLRVSLSK